MKQLDFKTIIGGVITIVLALLIVDWFKNRKQTVPSSKDGLALIDTASEVTSSPANPGLSQ